MEVIRQRISRLDLNTAKNYEKVQKVNGVEVYTRVGRFVRAYRMGSGDGMTVHWEFELDGNKLTVDDEMWGSVGGQELIGFREV